MWCGRRGLLTIVAAVTVLAAVRPAHAQVAARPALRTIRGLVRDSTGAPVPGATVRLLIAGALVNTTRTADGGTFTIEGRLTDDTWLQVRRIGFQPWETAMGPDRARDSLYVILRATAAEIEAVDVVEQREIAGWLSDFTRRQRTNSFGHFYTRETIRKRSAHLPSELLRTLPGVSLQASQSGTVLIRMRGCRVPPLVWIDGVRLPRAELDELVNLQDIAGMEVYLGNAGIPAQFMDRSNGGCGTILVWTRHR